MNKVEYAIIGHATFGHPNDFRQSLIFTNEPNKKSQFSSLKVFDLSQSIKVFPGNGIYSVRKENYNNIPFISFSKYSFAQEKKSKRDGAFIGTSIVFKGTLPKIGFILQALECYHEQLKSDNLINSVLQVEHSDEFIKPEIDFLKNELAIPKLTFTDLKSNNPNKSIVFSINQEEKEITNGLENSLRILDKFEVVYFTSDIDTLNYTKLKGLYIIKPINNLAEQIKSIQIEKNKNHQQNITSLENRRASALSQIKEIQSSLTSTLREKEKEKNSINADIDKIQRADSKLKEVLRNCDSDFNNLIKDFSSRQIMMDQVRSKENQIQKNVQNELQSLRDIIQHSQTSKRIQEQQYRTNQHSNSSSIKTPQIESHDNSGFGIDIFEIVSIILSILLIGSWVYFLFFQDPEIVYQNPPNTNQETIQNLIPNAYLQPSELNNVNKKLKKDMNIDTIISIIFQQNPNDVARHYKKDIHNYKIFLYNNNKHCFLKANSQFTLIEDSLVIIPCYKSK
jgi:hypothetical protein